MMPQIFEFVRYAKQRVDMIFFGFILSPTLVCLHCGFVSHFAHYKHMPFSKKSIDLAICNEIKCVKDIPAAQ